MIRFLLRALGLLFLAAAFVFLVYDGTRSIADGRLEYTDINEVWSIVHAASLQQAQQWIESHAPQWVAAVLLGAPAVVTLGVIGALLIPLGRRKKDLIGYAR
jgi:hypothetical protein